MKTTLHLMNDRRIIASADATTDLLSAFRTLMDKLIEDADTNYVCEISDTERLTAKIMKVAAEDAKTSVVDRSGIVEFYAGDPANYSPYYSVGIQEEAA